MNIDFDKLRERYASPQAHGSKTHGGGSCLDVPAYLAHYGRTMKEAKINGSSTLYLLDECVFDSNHRNREAAIGQTDEGKLFYQCFHDSCSGKTWHDARREISGDDTLSVFYGGTQKPKDTTPTATPEPAREDCKQDLKDLILPASSFMTLPVDPREYYLYPWLREQSVILISGARGCGKSWFTLSILLAVCGGTEFGPWQSQCSAPCLYLDGEMVVSDVIERLTLIQAPPDTSMYIYSDAFVTERGLPRAHLANKEWRDKMKSILLDLGIKLWAIDNISSLASGLDENSKQDWDPINSWLLDLRFAGISTILVHHTGKAGTQRGTSGKEDNLDISILLKHPADYTNDDGCRVVADFTKARVAQKYRHLIEAQEFRLVTDEGGLYSWHVSNPQRDTKRDCLRMLAAGTKYEEICKALGLGSKSYITKLRRDFITKGWLTDDGKLTDKGDIYLT